MQPEQRERRPERRQHLDVGQLRDPIRREPEGKTGHECRHPRCPVNL